MLDATVCIWPTTTSDLHWLSLRSTATENQHSICENYQRSTIPGHASLESLYPSLEAQRLLGSGSYQTMLATEDVLRRDWDSSEEDTAWADL